MFYRVCFLFLLMLAINIQKTAAQCGDGGAGNDVLNCTGTETTTVSTGTGNDIVNLNGQDIIVFNVPNATPGVDAGGNVTVNGPGTISTTGFNDDGISAQGDVVSSATITTTGQNADGIVTFGGAVNNSSISTNNSVSIGIIAHGHVENNGSILTQGPGSAGILAFSTAENNGTIVTTNVGSAGIAATGDVENTGTISATSYAIAGSNNAQTITVSDGTLTGGWGAIEASGGNDSVIITVEEVTINGIVNGGAGTDQLIFQGATTDAVGWNAVEALVGCNPCAGTVTIDGKSYLFQNFEQLLNHILLIALPQSVIAVEFGSAVQYPMLLCDDGVVKVFATETHLEIYGGFASENPNGFLITAIASGEIQAGTQFQNNWSGLLLDNGYIRVMNGSGTVVSEVCRYRN